MKEHARLFNHQTENIDVIAVCDEATDTYAIVNVGWDGKERMNVTSVLLRIVKGKIWIEVDRTMTRFVDELLEAGIAHAMTLSSPFNRHRCGTTRSLIA